MAEKDTRTNSVSEDRKSAPDDKKVSIQETLEKEGEQLHISEWRGRFTGKRVASALPRINVGYPFEVCLHFNLQIIQS